MTYSEEGQSDRKTPVNVGDGNRGGRSCSLGVAAATLDEPDVVSNDDVADVVSAPEEQSVSKPSSPSTSTQLSLELRIEKLLAQSSMSSFLSSAKSESDTRLPEEDCSSLEASSDQFGDAQSEVQQTNSEDDASKKRHVRGGVSGDANVGSLSRKVSDRLRKMSTAVDEDDRMSLSSLSSGEEKLEVMESSQSQTSINDVAAGTELSTTGGCKIKMVPPSALDDASPNVVAETQQSSLPVTLQQHRRKLVDGTVDDVLLSKFEVVLEKVMSELRLVICRDMRKKMIENTAFKSLEEWCQEKNVQNKVNFRGIL